MSLEEKFINELDKKIRKKQFLERIYRYLQLLLMSVVTACGFLTAASTNDVVKDLWISQPHIVLLFGLISAVAAIVNQVLAPAEKYLFHKNVKKALIGVKGAVQFRGMSIEHAERYRFQAAVDPMSVIVELSSQ